MWLRADVKCVTGSWPMCRNVTWGYKEQQEASHVPSHHWGFFNVDLKAPQRFLPNKIWTQLGVRQTPGLHTCCLENPSTRTKNHSRFAQREGETNKLLTQQIIWIIFFSFLVLCHFASYIRWKRDKHKTILIYCSPVNSPFCALEKPNVDLIK